MSNYYDEQPQASDPLSNPRVVTAIVLIIAAILGIIGIAALFFFINRGGANQPTQQIIVQVTSLPTLTPSLTPIFTETPEPTLEEGTGGGGDATPDLTATFANLPAIRYATLSEIRGLVEYKNDTVGDWRAVSGDLSIPQGTSVRTGENSSVKLTLTEGTVLRVSSQTQFVLTQLSGTTVDPITTITLDFGKLWNIVVTTPGTTSYEVFTPLGKASVRGSFMSTEHNSTEELDIITCLESVRGCSYSVEGVGVQTLDTGEMLTFQKGGTLPSPDRMGQADLNDWAPTKIPEVLTLTPTATSTPTPTGTRTPTVTRTPSNTPNVEATNNSAATKTVVAATNTSAAGSNSGTQTQSAVNQTATQNSGNLTATVFFFNVSATSLFQSTSNSFTATSFAFTATSFSGTAAANATNSSFTQTASVNQTNASIATATWVSTIATATQAAVNQTSTAGAALTQTASVPVINFASGSILPSVSESSGRLTLTVQISNPVPVNVPITVSFSNASATGAAALASGGGADYDNNDIESTTLIGSSPTTQFFIPANQTSATFDVLIADDGTAEVNETFQVLIACTNNPCGGGAIVGSNTTSTVTVVNVSTPSAGFTASSYAVSEASSTVTITLSLSRAYANVNTVTMAYSMSPGGTATGGAACAGAVDFDNDSFTPASPISFAPGETTKTFTLDICPDTSYENAETFNLQTSVTSGNASLGLGTTTVSITNDDTVPNLTYTVNTTPVTEPGGLGTTTTVTFDFTLSGASGLDTTFDYGTAANTASDGLDYVGESGTVTITAGSTTGSFDIVIKGDTLNELSETFNVNISNVTNATLTSAATQVVTIDDDGDTAPAATFSLDPYTMTEGNSGSQQVQIVVNFNRQSGQTIVLGYSTSDTGSCANKTTAGIDYATATGTLIFPPGSISNSFFVTVYGDTLVETDECLTINLNLVSGTATGLPTSTELWILTDGS